MAEKKKRTHDPEATLRNKIMRTARNHKKRSKNPFTGRVSDPNNCKYPSQEALKFVTQTLKTKFRISTAKSK